MRRSCAGRPPPGRELVSDPDPLTERDREVYLEGLRSGLTMAKAAEVAGRHPSSFRRLADRDAVFAAEVRVAYHEVGRDALIERLQAVVEGDVRWSATTLMFLIKQRDPSFRENAKLELDAGVVRPEVKISLDFGGALAALEQAGLVGRPVAGDVDAAVGVGAGRPSLLPARADVEADGGVGGASASSG